jgi:PAS domain S-box-containing protein
VLNKDDFSRAIVDWLNDYAPQGIVITDTSFAIRGWNRWMEQQTGRATDEVLGKGLFEIFPEVRSRGLDRYYQMALEGAPQVLAYRFHRYLLKIPSKLENLSEMQQTARIAPLVDNGRIVGTITAIEDVSERVVREAELWLARDEAEMANRAKDKFLATLSHDLRTPLGSILGWIQIMKRTPANDETIATGRKSIEQSARVQLQLIDQLLDISRIESGKLQLEIETADLIDIVEVSADALRPAAAARKVDLQLRMPAERRLCRVDPKRLQQVVWNLVSNAIKFSNPDGIIVVKLDYDAECAEIRVTDSGVGIDARNLDHVFEPLWQAEETSPGKGGLGLGLSIVNHVVQLHHGTIRAESPGLGLGATFVVRLPCPPQSAGEAQSVHRGEFLA